MMLLALDGPSVPPPLILVFHGLSLARRYKQFKWYGSTGVVYRCVRIQVTGWLPDDRCSAHHVHHVHHDDAAALQ
jgi:hypothetical protein